ncbi:MAG: hypothetical protein QFY14_01275 [Candidatus Phytoplasma pruni]|nr:hypothetical protein [Candidatus Phytoplasma pruni]
MVFKYKELNDKYSLKSKELRDFKKNFLKKIIAFFIKEQINPDIEHLTKNIDTCRDILTTIKLKKRKKFLQLFKFQLNNFLERSLDHRSLIKDEDVLQIIEKELIQTFLIFYHDILLSQNSIHKSRIFDSNTDEII